MNALNTRRYRPAPGGFCDIHEGNRSEGAVGRRAPCVTLLALPLSVVWMVICGYALPAAVDENDLDTLLDGVAEIAAPGAPGPLCVYGRSAFPVIAGATSGVRAAVAAAGPWGAGRVIVLGHDGYFHRPTLDKADTGRFMTNALRWAAGEDSQDGPRIGVVSDVGTGENQLRDWLTAAGEDAVDVALTPTSLGAVDVVALTMWNQSVPEIRALRAFVRGGGGLVTASTGWGWAYLHPGLDLVNDYAGNRLLRPVGIQWADDSIRLGRTSEEGYAVDGPPDELTHAGKALDAVEAHEADRRTLTQPQIDQAIDSLVRAAGCLPPDDTLLAPRLRALVQENDRWPSAEQPVTNADVIPRLAAGLFVIEHRRTPAESVRAHPAADDFPGSVPADAPRVTRTLTIDTTEPRGHSTGPQSRPRAPRWHSTGLYAAPGELVTVTMPEEAAETGSFHVRIGAHSDRIWRRKEWTRMPEISRRFPVSAATTLVANAFGGLIYIEVPAEIPDDADLGSIEVEIEGAVAAPLYVRGETDQTAWRDEIRHAPAPWAEIVGRNMIVTTEASEVRELDDPAAVPRIWDRLLNFNADLAAWPSRRRARQERFVVDRQISHGYMHAGYPLMAHMDQKSNLVDYQYLRTCAEGASSGSLWGLFHEVGHNHQSADWTFDGTVEVTVNLFTLYVFEFQCGIVASSVAWANRDRTRAELMASYDFDDPDFEQWKNDPALALVMYEQMQEAFGWEAYRQVFAEYRDLPDAERPKSDDEKRDQWLVRFSREVDRNLGPFFETWGVPTSRDARRSIADLPQWMPPNFPPAKSEETQAAAASLTGAAEPPVGDVGERPRAQTDAQLSVFTAADGTEFRVETVVTDLKAPTSLDFAADGRLFVTEQEGRVWVVEPERIRPELALTLGEASRSGGSDLLDLALDPAFPENHFVFLLEAGHLVGGVPASRLVRYRETGNALAQPAVLLDGLPFAASGRIRFSPDGLLHLALAGRNVADKAQDPADFGGKILRVRTDDPAPGEGPAKTQVFSLGHHDPGGFDWHPLTGTLWVAEPGGAVDEVNRVEAGANYGWPVIEGFQALPGMRAPWLSLSPSIAPSGASFYDGAALAGFRNDLFVAALDGAHLLRIRFDPGDQSRIIATERLLDGLFGRLRDVVTGPAGGLYVATSNRDGYGIAVPGDDRVIRLMPAR